MKTEKEFFSKRPKWIDIIQNSTLKELWAMGGSRVLLGFQSITNAIKINMAYNIYTKVASQSTDPFEWYLLSRKHKELFIGNGILPFDLTSKSFQELTEKISTILTIRVNAFQ